MFIWDFLVFSEYTPLFFLIIFYVFISEHCLVYQLFLNLYITYTKFYKFLFLVNILLGFKIINWLKTSLSRLLNRLVGQTKLNFYVSRVKPDK